MPRPDPPLPPEASYLRVRSCPSHRHHIYTRCPDRAAAEKLIELYFQIHPDTPAWAIISRLGKVLAIRTRPGTRPPNLGQGRLF